MTIKAFNKKLEKIAKEHGASAKVVMADGILIVGPVYLENFLNKKVVVITDQK